MKFSNFLFLTTLHPNNIIIDALNHTNNLIANFDITGIFDLVETTAQQNRGSALYNRGKNNIIQDLQHRIDLQTVNITNTYSEGEFPVISEITCSRIFSMEIYHVILAATVLVPNFFY